MANGLDPSLGESGDTGERKRERVDPTGNRRRRNREEEPLFTTLVAPVKKKPYFLDPLQRRKISRDKSTVVLLHFT